jgi:hypothetical protein
VGVTASRSKRDTGRDSGGFVAMPWSVLDCAAYARLSHPARGLLMEFARQFVRDNNGRLLASGAYLATRGWKSADVIFRAKRELLDAGFIFETVKGQRPNKASWYAVTWRSLDKCKGYDFSTEKAFERGAYLKNEALKIDPLTPRDGIKRSQIAPSDGVEQPATTPSHGAIRTSLPLSSTPSDGGHLENYHLHVEMPDIGIAAALASLHGEEIEQPLESDSTLVPVRTTRKQTNSHGAKHE